MPRGGRRDGAGRKAGTGWLPAVANMRVSAAEQLTQLVGSAKDPLTTVLEIASDTALDAPLRLSAAAIALPFMYPRLSATSVSAHHTVAKIDTNEILQRLEERISRASALPAPSEDAA